MLPVTGSSRNRPRTGPKKYLKKFLGSLLNLVTVASKILMLRVTLNERGAEDDSDRNGN